MNKKNEEYRKYLNDLKEKERQWAEEKRKLEEIEKKTERIIKIKPRKIQYNILIIKNNKKTKVETKKNGDTKLCRKEKKLKEENN